MIFFSFADAVCRAHFSISLLTICFPFIIWSQVDLELSELHQQGLNLCQTNPDSSTLIFKMLLERANQVDSIEKAASALYNIGANFMAVGNFDSASFYFHQAEERYTRIESYHGLTLANISLGNLDNFRGNVQGAIPYYHTALDFAVLNEDTFSQVRILNNLGAAFNSAGRIQQALLTLEQGLELAQTIGNSVLLGDLNNNISTNYEALKEFDLAYVHGKKAAHFFREAGDHEYEALALTNLAAYLLAKDSINPDTVGHYLKAGKSILDSIYSPSILTNYYRQLAHYYTETNQLQKAKMAADSCLILLQEFSNQQGTAQIYERLYKIYKSEGDMPNALAYLEKFFVVRDSMVYAESNNQLQELEARYQSATKDALLARQALEISNHTNQRNLYLMIALIAVALVAFLFYRHKQKEINMLDQVALQKEQIQNLKKQQQIVALDYLLQGQEEERKRIAQDLHDGLGGLLATAQVKVQHVISKNQSRNHAPALLQSANLIGEACQEVRRIAHDMMPGALIKIGLIAALSDLVDTYNENSDISFYFEAPDDEFPIDDKKSISIYRIIQEILNNAFKYSQAERVQLQILREHSDLTIFVSDDGIGFDPHQTNLNAGLGIKGIRGRVEHWGGRFSLQTQLGNGVNYEIHIPGIDQN